MNFCARSQNNPPCVCNTLETIIEEKKGIYSILAAGRELMEWRLVGKHHRGCISRNYPSLFLSNFLLHFPIFSGP